MAQFPPKGQNLEAFGLAPIKISHLSVPNNLQAWPFSALNGCVNLESISVYGAEDDAQSITLAIEHGLKNLSKLTTLQFPSTVTSIDDGVWDDSENSIQMALPINLKSVTFAKRLKSIGSQAFARCRQLSCLDFSQCPDLSSIGRDAFFYCEKLTSLDLSGTKAPLTIVGAAFRKSSLGVVIFPTSLLAICDRAFATLARKGPLPSLQTIIWKGCTERLPITTEVNPPFGISHNAFWESTRLDALDNLISTGRLTEIFTP